MIGRRLREIMQARSAWSIAALLWIVHGFVEWRGGYEQCETLFKVLGLSNVGIRQGYFWQWISYAFLHGSWMHVSTNALMIVFLGASLQVVYPGAVVWRVFALSCLAGGLMHSVLGGNGTDVLVGASGGAIGLLLFYCTLSPQSRMLPFFVSAGNLGAGVLLSSSLLCLLHLSLQVPDLSHLLDFLPQEWQKQWFRVGHACHFGGGLAGWLCGRWVLRQRVSLADLQKQRRMREEQG